MNRVNNRLLTLCADDFGQSAAINQGILQLLQLDRLHAVSVMSQGPAWAVGAPALNEFREGVDIGLHLNLTHRFGNDIHARPLSVWLLRAFSGGIDQRAVRDTFRRQIDLFVQQLGRLPDYLDGHQHVHAFPGVREVLPELISEYWQATNPPWVRAPDRLIDDGRVPFKAWVLRRATRGFVERLEHTGLRYNTGFAGLYALTPSADFVQLMQEWLHSLPTNTLMMVHPGEQSDDTHDPIRTARYIELEYLRGAAFGEQLRAAGVTLARLASFK